MQPSFRDMPKNQGVSVCGSIKFLMNESRETTWSLLASKASRTFEMWNSWKSGTLKKSFKHTSEF